jgi:hypothetical protein
MKLILRRLIIGSIIVGALAIGTIWARLNGVLPGICDTSALEYAKLCGIKPTSGIVWCWSPLSLQDGCIFYRFHLKKSEFNPEGHTPLHQRELPDMPKAPWWWGEPPSNEVSFKRGVGLGHGTISYEVYSKSTETMYVYTEWD